MKTWKQNTFLGMVVILTITLVLLACGNDTSEPKTIDSRLIGGKFTLYRTTPDQFIRFTSTTYTVASSGELSAITTNAYTKDGKVLSVDGNIELIRYAFIQPSEYDDEFAAAIATGDQQRIYAVHDKVAKAKSGLFVRFTIPGTGTVMEWFNWSIYDSSR
jgi:hypothetical protein